MADDSRQSNRSAKDLGSDSPASSEAAEQTRSGMQGAPRGEGEKGGTDRQPAQSSGRSGRGPAPSARKSYDEGERPSEQGDGSASPERIKASDAQQGAKGAGGAAKAGQARGDHEATEHER